MIKHSAQIAHVEPTTAAGALEKMIGLGIYDFADEQPDMFSARVETCLRLSRIVSRIVALCIHRDRRNPLGGTKDALIGFDGELIKQVRLLLVLFG
jgi:hypothetical protein